MAFLERLHGPLKVASSPIPVSGIQQWVMDKGWHECFFFVNDMYLMLMKCEGMKFLYLGMQRKCNASIVRIQDNMSITEQPTR